MGNSLKKLFSSDIIWLACAIMSGSFLRLYLISNGVTLDADEAVVGLMAKHIAEGEEIPVFYYGQHYMGSLEAILASFSFQIFGVSNFTLKIIPYTTSLILIIVMFLLGKELYNNVAGRLAALFTAISPTMLIQWSTKARGGFIEVVLIGALALLITLKWIKNPTKKLTLLIGLLLGLGWWVNNQVIYFILPIGLWMLLRLLPNFLTIFQHFLLGFIAFLLGGLPFWIYNINHDFVTFEMFGAAGGKGIVKNVNGLFNVALPIVLGAKKDWSLKSTFLYSDIVGWCGLGFFLLIYIIWRRREICRLLMGKLDLKTPLELFFVFILSVLLIYSLSSFGSFIKEPRYLLPIYVGLIALLASILAYIMQANRFLGYLLVVCVMAFNLLSYKSALEAKEPEVFEGERVSRDHSDIIKLLHKLNIKFIRTDYWIGYRLAFETDEEITFVTFYDPIQDRIPKYLKKTKGVSLSSIPLVVVPKQAEIIRTAYETLGMSYKEESASGYILFYDQHNFLERLETIPKSNMEVEASVKNEQAQFAIDGDLKTRWGSGEPQKPLMRFMVTFKEPQRLQGLWYAFADWKHDFPRELRIEIEAPNGERKVLVEPKNYMAVKYLLKNEELQIRFPPFLTKRVYFVQEGFDSFFDWSIAELYFYK